MRSRMELPHKQVNRNHLKLHVNIGPYGPSSCLVHSSGPSFSTLQTGKRRNGMALDSGPERVALGTLSPHRSCRSSPRVWDQGDPSNCASR